MYSAFPILTTPWTKNTYIPNTSERKISYKRYKTRLKPYFSQATLDSSR